MKTYFLILDSMLRCDLSDFTFYFTNSVPSVSKARQAKQSNAAARRPIVVTHTSWIGLKGHMQKRVTQSLIVKVFWTFSHTDDAYSANEMELLLKTLPINLLLV